MVENIYDPLSEYINVFSGRFKEIAKSTFESLANEANVDVEANRETCRQLYSMQHKLSSLNKRIGWWTVFGVFLWILVIFGILVAFIKYNALSQNMLFGIGVIVSLSLLIFFFLIHPRLKVFASEQKELKNTINKLKKEAWKQMAPLNKLYDWDVLTRMMTKTVPRLEFDPYFTTQRLADLKETYGWDDSFSEKRSVIYSHSGLINGNPFVICRTRKMVMGQKTYTGYKTIHWTTRERGADGKYHAVHHSQTLAASVTAPYPEYFEKTRLFYGNTAAPDLIFNRRQSGLAGKDNSLSFKWKRWSLRKKARNLKEDDFAMMTNETFEVAFDTSDRNNNQQFALLFTPLAQESMLKLLKDKKAGYGDDFDFHKHKMINTIIANHIQDLNLDMNPNQYRNFDYDKAQKDFYTINATYFRAIYFCLAPLLCVPMYQQIRSQQDIYGHDMQRHSAFWEHEALANFWGQDKFKDARCVTNCILKTEQSQIDGDQSKITVYAHGYRVEHRVNYVNKWGGDGRMHKVTVRWDEYLPVTGIGNICMKEDNSFRDDNISQHQRLNHIGEFLGNANLDFYRRHIASKI